jgi:uncharacterized membrane protein (UPF0127 family)
MNTPGLILSRIIDRLRRRRTTTDLRLQISNVTRDTVLATCAELADSSGSRRKGLLGRKLLRHGEGLWILPCESVHTFGMRFPIDLVYMDRTHRVRKVKSDVPPWRVSVCFSADSVLELAAGTIRETSTAPGDVLELVADHSRYSPS